jgi:predicted nucleic acid-binding protein
MAAAAKRTLMRISTGCEAMTEFDSAARIYVDTNIWIYYLEAHPELWEAVDEIFAAADLAGATLFTSEITIAECLVKPARLGDEATVKLYQTFFDEGGVVLTRLDGALARRAAISSGPLGLKLIDSIHYVSAREAGCTHMLTRDGRFKSDGELTVIGVG